MSTTAVVEFRFFTKDGNRLSGKVQTVEGAILGYRAALKSRKNPAIRGTGEYRISSGAEWLKI